MNSGEDLFFRDYIFLVAEIKDRIAEVRRELQKIPMCRGQNNNIFRIELILGTKARNLSLILGENFFFSDHLNLETKFNKNGLKMPRFLKNLKNVP